MSGHTHKGWYSISPGEAGEAAEEADTRPSTRADPSRVRLGGAVAAAGPEAWVAGGTRSDTFHKHAIQQTCSFRFFKQNRPLKMYLQTLSLPQAYT